jgi:hypothetical protein
LVFHLTLKNTLCLYKLQHLQDAHYVSGLVTADLYTQ